MATAASPTSRFVDGLADEILAISGVLNRAIGEAEWQCAKADRFRDAMQGRVLELSAFSLDLRRLADLVDGRHWY
ncbi:MAG: hypothetical protein IT195_01025 [Microthrixaceae bacterium]|nr:hypothetical protein [Microthrixaceae bacterium]